MTPGRQTIGITAATRPESAFQPAARRNAAPFGAKVLRPILSSAFASQGSVACHLCSPSNSIPRRPPPCFGVGRSARCCWRAGLGFLAGATYANRSADRGFRKSLRAISSLYALALDSLDKRSTFRPCWRPFQGPSWVTTIDHSIPSAARLSRRFRVSSPNSGRRWPRRSRPKSNRSRSQSRSPGSGLLLIP